MKFGRKKIVFVIDYRLVVISAKEKGETLVGNLYIFI